MIVRKPEAEKRMGKKLKGRKSDWFLLSSMGTRKLGGPYRTRTEAEERERQVQYFKRQANPGVSQLRKVAELHPEDRAIVGSAVGSVAGFMIAPPLAPLGAAAGHIAGKRMGQPKQNPIFGKKKEKARAPKRKKHRSLRSISLDIKKSWRDPWESGPENRQLLRIKNTVDAMQTLCDLGDVVEAGPSRGKSGDFLVGDFLSSAGFWKGSEAKRLKNELRAIMAEQYWHGAP